MSESLVTKLLESFDELEQCIETVKTVLAQKDGVPEDVLQRVTQYSGIVSKQRGLALDLKKHLSTRNWQEVGRHVKLINGLSSMIRDDARSILAGAAELPSASDESDLLL